MRKRISHFYECESQKRKKIEKRRANGGENGRRSEL